MKKLLLSALTLTLLCGCGGSSSKNTKTCSVEQDGGTMTVTVTADDGTNINKVDAKLVVDSENLASAGLGETLEEVEASLTLANTMMDTMEQEGFTIEMKIENESLVTEFTIDLDKMDEEALADLGIDLGDVTTLESFVANAEADGGTCK